MYTLWTFLEVLATAGESEGFEGVEGVLNGSLQTVESRRANTFRVEVPEITMNGRIDDLSIVTGSSGKLLRLDMSVKAVCITKSEVKKHFPDLYLGGRPVSPSVLGGNNVPFTYVSRIFDVPILFTYFNNSAFPDCLESITIDYQSRIDEYGMPPPPREEASVQESSEQ